MTRNSIVAGISSIFNESLVERLRLRAMFELSARVANRQRQLPVNAATSAVPALSSKPLAPANATPIPADNPQRGA